MLKQSKLFCILYLENTKLQVQLREEKEDRNVGVTGPNFKDCIWTSYNFKSLKVLLVS